MLADAIAFLYMLPVLGYFICAMFFGTLFFKATFPYTGEEVLVIILSIFWPITLPVYLAWLIAKLLRQKFIGD